MLRIYPPITTHYPPVNTKKAIYISAFWYVIQLTFLYFCCKRERRGEKKKITSKSEGTSWKFSSLLPGQDPGCVAPSISFTLVLGLSAGLRLALFSFSRKLLYQASRRKTGGVPPLLLMLQWAKNVEKQKQENKPRTGKHRKYGMLLECLKCLF